MKWMLYTLLIALSGCSSTRLPYIDEHKSKQEVLAIFSQSTVKAHGYAPANTRNGGRIGYYLDPAGQISAQRQQDWDALIRLLQHETPLRFVPVPQPEAADLVITLLRAPTAGAKEHCSITETLDHNFAPAVLTKVQAESSRVLSPCVVRAIMQVTGFESIDRNDTLSPLNTRSALSQPSSTDLYLINLLLRSKLERGMPATEVMAVIDASYDTIQLSPDSREAIESLEPEKQKVLFEVLQRERP